MTKQKNRPTLERATNTEVEKAAEDYRAKRDTRMAAMKPEAEAKTKLLDLMKAHKLKDYRYEAENGDGESVEFQVERESKESVKVKTAKEDDDSSPESEEVE